MVLIIAIYSYCKGNFLNCIFLCCSLLLSLCKHTLNCINILHDQNYNLALEYAMTEHLLVKSFARASEF